MGFEGLDLDPIVALTEDKTFIVELVSAFELVWMSAGLGLVKVPQSRRGSRGERP